MKTINRYKKVCHITVLASAIILVVSGCTHKVKVHRYKRVAQKQAISYPKSFYTNANTSRAMPKSNNLGVIDNPNRYVQNFVHLSNSTQNFSNGAPMKIARNRNEITQQAIRTKPIYVSYQPLHIPSNVEFVNLSAYRNIMLQIINSLRAQTVGNYPGMSFQPVVWNRYLAKAAEAHARDMAVHNFISHLGSGGRTDYARKAPGQGSTFYDRIIFYGYPAKPGHLAGEILTITKDKIVGTRDVMPHFKHAIENFLRSKKHTYVLENPRLNRIGIAAYRAGNHICWVMELVEE